MEQNQIIEQIWQLQTWFETYYKEHDQKFRRLHTLGLKTDDGKDPYSELLKLYSEAETNRKKIQELEVRLGLV